MAWTSPRTWLAGETVTAALLNTHLRDNLKALGDPWTAYTPTWTAVTTNPTLGNGTLTGFYMQTGKLIAWRLRLTIGSTTNVGSGAWLFTLPVAGDSSGFDTAGSGLVRDDPAGTYTPVIARLFGGQTDFIGPAGKVGSASPITWGTGDTLSGVGVYEAI